MLKETLLAASLLFALEASANVPSPPSLKPSQSFVSKVVSPRDANLLREAFDAADRGDWHRTARLQEQARDDVVRDLVVWRRATEGDPLLGFDELSVALERFEDWPRRARIRAAAEEAIQDSALSHAARSAWLETSGPRTGTGKLTLARSLQAIGEHERAVEAVRRAWRGNTLTGDETRSVLADYRDDLTQDDHRARVDFLLWTGQRSAANRMKPYLTADWQRLVEARIALAARRRGVDRAVSAVPQHLQDHPGLLYDRARWRRQRGMSDAATPLLTGIDGNDIPTAGRTALWRERHMAVRRSLRDEEYATAYALASPHGLESGVPFAEAEWVSGWIALRMKDDPDRAVRHFETLRDGVSSPISVSRAHYWTGRSLRELGETDAADASFREGATFNYTYYGQLSGEQVGERTITLEAAPAPSEADRTAFEARSIVRALRLLAEAGESSLFRTFAYHLDDRLERPEDFTLLYELGKEYHYTDIGVRGAKAGLSRGIVAADAAYPIVDYPLLREPRVERALMLALTRQESEMNPRAISHANARGLMQFLPATARHEARRRGLPFRTSWLTDDPGYNLTLGGAHLDTLLDQFNGSYIMAASSYNAGATRTRQWLRDYGDPRAGDVDPIDWVELIPFSETRNYVQRVLENTQVYRHRLSGQPEEILIEEDLERGRFD